jgi:putative ABC transport system permease protein
MNNFFKSTLRFFWRQRLFTLLNVMGLAIGISASWVIYRIVDYEFSFDKDHPESEQIYQLINRSERPDGTKGGFAGITKGVLPLLLEGVSGLEAAVPMYYRYSETVKVQGKEPRVIENPSRQVGTLPAYFDMVPYTWLAGNPQTALTAPDQVVLTESRAQQYFPGLPAGEVVGKTLIYNDTSSFSVSGVVADLEFLSSFDVQEIFLISNEDNASDTWSFMNSNDLLYVKLSSGNAANAVLKIINDENSKRNQKDFEEYNYKNWYELMPLSEKHFAVEFGQNTRTANKKVLFGLIGVAGFLLALACINYINLTTAQLPFRAKEIGIRKTLGGAPKGIIYRFLGETFLISLFALLLSFLFSFIAVRVLKDYMPEGLEQHVHYIKMIVFGIGLIIFVTLVAGIYPAYLITRVRTAQVLKGQTERLAGSGRNTLRKSLIVFQFVIAQVFIVSAVIIGEQLRYALNKDMGFNHEAVFTINIPWKIQKNEKLRDRKFALKQELKNQTNIAAVSLGSLPMNDDMMATVLSYQSDTGKVQNQVTLKNVDADYIGLYEIPLIAGKNMQPSDTTREYVINEVARKAFGFATPEDAIGKQLISWGEKSLPITGVVRDFHQMTVHSKIEASAFISERSDLNSVNIKLSPLQADQWSKTIAGIERSWKKFYPSVPFEYHFYDETLARLYTQDQNTSRLIGLATGVTIFISCLGLFGLATLTAFQRTKEVGIRKVLGATVTGIVRLLSADFIKLVLIAVLIASPIAWWAMNKWLEDFAYRVEVQWWMFAAAGIIAVLIALFTVSFQAVKAAVANPVDSLRDE